MAGKLLFVFAVIVCLSTALAALLPPQCSPPRVRCDREQVDGAVFWESMQYEYVAKKSTWHEAEAICKAWDEKVCVNSGGFVGFLVSFLNKEEFTDAAQKAYHSACVRSGDYYWTGAKYLTSSRIRYSDGLSSTFRAFGSSQVSSLGTGKCLAVDGRSGTMVVRSCSEKLGFVCKIAPFKH